MSLFGLFRRRGESLDQLSKKLNSMAAQLQAQIRDLESQRSQLEGVLEGMSEGVLVEGPGGEILLINPAARSILDIKEVPPGARSGDLIRHPVLREMIGRVRSEGRPQSQDLTLYSPSERHLRVRGDACRSTAGPAALLVFHDITDLKRLENLRRDFVANVSHELKTPLTAIQGAVETLLGGALQDADRGKPFVESVAEEAGRLHRLVEDLLTLAQVESGQGLKREPVSLRVFFQEETARHQKEAGARGVSLELEPVPPDLSLPADRGQLVQAVGNLLENAVKYNRPEGRVIVRVSINGRECRIEVEDTGIGIPAEDLPRVFERFYRVDKGRSRESGGTGLGLSIVKHVAEAHGGSVQVESRPGTGSRFTLILPLQ